MKTAKLKAGSLLALPITPSLLGACKIAFVSKKTKCLTGIAFYGAWDQVGSDAFSRSPLGRFFAADYAIEELLKQGGELLGTGEVTPADLECCRFVESGKTYHGDDEVPSQLEDELLGTPSVSLGADAVLQELRLLAGVTEAPLTAELDALLHGSTKLKRYYAALRIAKLGPLAADAKAALLSALHDEGKSVRRMAAMALGRLHCPDANVVKAIAHLKDDNVQEVRATATWAWERLTSAESARPYVYL